MDPLNTPHPYEVALVDAPEVPTAARINAESRFAQVVERAFGGPEEVVHAYRQWIAANESPPEDLTADEVSVAARWHRVTEDAKQAAFRNLGDMPGAHFEVRLRRAS